MTELKTYDMEYDREEPCPFCGRVYTGINQDDYHEWWAPTECLHMCCSRCAVYYDQTCSPLCPQCAREEGERNGRPA
jgi:hypothetical protein